MRLEIQEQIVDLAARRERIGCSAFSSMFCVLAVLIQQM